jgi:hypothetical protein
VVKSLPVDPTSGDWQTGLKIERGRVPRTGSEQGIAAVTRSVESVIDQVTSATIGLAWVRDEVTQAVQSEAEVIAPQPSTDSVSDGGLTMPDSTEATAPLRPPGRLF